MFAWLLQSSRRLFFVQTGLIAGGFLTLNFYPPADGPMALIALDGRDAGWMAKTAIAGGGTLLGRGPLSNILIVNGSRDRIARHMLASGVLVVAAPKSWCGSEGSSR